MNEIEKVLTQVTDLTGTIIHVMGSMDKRMDDMDKNISLDSEKIEQLQKYDNHKSDRLNGYSTMLETLGCHLAKLEGLMNDLDQRQDNQNMRLNKVEGRLDSLCRESENLLNILHQHDKCFKDLVGWRNDIDNQVILNKNSCFDIGMSIDNLNESDETKTVIIGYHYERLDKIDKILQKHKLYHDSRG